MIADAAAIVAGTVAEVDTRGATREGGEPLHTANPSERTVWYNWTAPTSGPASLTTAGSDFDTIVSVYTGDIVGSLNQIAANDDVTPGVMLRSEVAFEAVARTTYRIALAGKDSAAGNADLLLSFSPEAAVNGDFANALPIVAGAVAQVSTVGATREVGEPLYAGNEGASTVWYSWTPTEAGEANFTTFGSDFDTTLAVYTGSQLASLNEIASNDDDIDLLSSDLTFPTEAGSTYHIALSGFGSAAGNAFLPHFFEPTPDFIPGDSNHDGRFDSSDLVVVFAAAEYEDDIVGNSTFEEGDWNGDGDFTTAELVFAFAARTYRATAFADQRLSSHDIIGGLFADDDRFKDRSKRRHDIDKAFAEDSFEQV